MVTAEEFRRRHGAFASRLNVQDFQGVIAGRDDEAVVCLQCRARRRCSGSG